MLNGLVAPFSISMRIGSGTLFFLILPALVILTDLTLSEPTSTSPKLSLFGRILSLPATGVGVAVGVAVRVGVGVAVAVGVAVGVAGVTIGLAAGTTTVKPLESFEANSPVAPAKLAVRVSEPAPLAVIGQVAMPCALVGALQFWPPAEKSMVWPGEAPFGLWLRLTKVVSEPGPGHYGLIGRERGAADCRCCGYGIDPLM